MMEVLVALVILTIGMMSIALLMASVYKTTVRSRYLSMAATLASEKLEDLNSYSPTDPRAHLAGGSLSAPPAGNLSAQSAPWNGGNVSVDYYDTVTLNNSSNSTTGAMNETFEILAPDGTTTQYVTQTFTADGLLHWDSTTSDYTSSPVVYYPSKPTTTPPTGVTFNRQWVIQNNTPVAGLNTITVLVTLMDKSITPPGTPPITFQMSTVRP